MAAGKARAIGLSNFTIDQLSEAAATASIAAVQNEYSLLVRDVERDLLPRCVELGVGLVPYFPLASGFLTGKYRPGQAPAGTRLGEVEDGASLDRPGAPPRSSRSTGWSASPPSTVTRCSSWRSPASPRGPAWPR